MSEPCMPQIDRRGSAEGDLWRQAQRVESTRALTAENHRFGGQILYRKSNRVKFNRNVIITGQLTNGNEILDNGGRNKDVIQMKRR